jgi:PAS domain S-box-containing protein
MILDVNGYKVLERSFSRDSLSDLIDSIPAQVASIDCNMVVQFVNKPFKKLFSSVENFSTNSFPVIVGKHIFDQVQRHLGKVLVGDHAQFNISISNGKDWHYLDVNLSPRFDARKRVEGFIFHSTDITEKLKTQQALHDYFENASIGLHWVNAEGIIIWANPAELDMLGYKEHEYIGQHISRFYKNNYVIKDILSRLQSKEVLKNYEAELLCKNGTTRHVAINSSVLWEGDKFVHTRCFTIDITEQKLAAKAVNESEERFRLMANLVPLVIWGTDETGHNNFLSNHWKELTGKTTDEGTSSQWFNFVHADDRTNIQHSWSKCFVLRKVFEAKFRLHDAQGGYIITYVNAVPRYGTQGEFLGYIGILQDISSQEQIKSSLEKIVLERTDDLRKRNADLKVAETALKEKNLELERINNQLSSFAHIASHDLQEPLRKIQTFTSRIIETEGSKLSDKGNDFINRIQAASGRMRSLINDLLSYSKTNSVHEHFELTDLNEVLKDVVTELELKIEEKNARIENLGLPQLCVMRFQLHQLFVNLVSNALKFSRLDVVPHIIIKAALITGDDIAMEKAKEYYHITIADNGIGFDTQFADKIFEVFQRLHRRNEFEGTGIGLSICKKIVENHKGLMTAEGTLNKGACFHVYLPA